MLRVLNAFQLRQKGRQIHFCDNKTFDGATLRKPAPSTFQAHKDKWRKAGTGYVTQINEKLWEDRHFPFGQMSKASSQRLRLQQGGMRNAAGRTDRGDESGDHRRKRVGESGGKGGASQTAHRSMNPGAPIFSVCGLLCGQNRISKTRLRQKVLSKAVVLSAPLPLPARFLPRCYRSRRGRPRHRSWDLRGKHHIASPYF